MRDARLSQEQAVFDHFHRHSAPVTHVNIEQQPNDAADAARLHGEIRDKALKEAEGAIIRRLGAHNEVLVASARSALSMCDMTTHVRALFTLNGKQYRVEVTEPQSLDGKTLEVIAQRIMVEIMRQLERRPFQPNEHLP